MCAEKISPKVYRGIFLIRGHLGQVPTPEMKPTMTSLRRSLDKLRHLGTDIPEPLDLWNGPAVAELLRQAMKVLRLLADDRPSTKLSSLLDYMDDYGKDRIVARPPAATAKQLGQAEEVISWLYWITDTADRRLVAGVAMGRSIAKVARSHPLTYDHCRKKVHPKCLKFIADRLTETGKSVPSDFRELSGYG